MPRMSQSQYQHYLDVTNSLRRLLHALDVHDAYYFKISESAVSGNMFGAAVFATSLAISPFHYGSVYLFVFGASVWTLSTAFGIYAQVAERSAYRKYMEKARHDLEDYLNYLRLIGNNEDMMGIVRNALTSIQSGFTDGNSHNNDNLNIHQNGHETETFEQIKTCVKITMKRIIAPFEILRWFIQKKFGMSSKLANEIRNVLSELESYRRRNQQADN